jgi:soluble epoxide hydrolase/lipid-phosphate phosphatase
VRAGYRVLAPDMLGYGGTDKPLDAEEYSTKKLCADLAALLDIVGVSRGVSSGNCDLQVVDIFRAVFTLSVILAIT